MKPENISSTAKMVAAAAVAGTLALAVTHHSDASPPQTALVAPALDTVALVAKVKSSVVNITVESSARRGGGGAASGDDADSSPFEFFRRNGPAGQAPDVKRHALGSGFIFDDKGHVLTNAHVIDGADRVLVRLSDERELEARVKGRDTRLDVAVLEIIGAKDLPYAVLGSSESTQVGEAVVAIGNPFGLGNTVTKGIVSAKGRAIGAGPYDDFLQTDASINPGNSGGPLFDSRGQVIGMNTAINPNGQGIGFAIPSDEIREVLPQLVSTGHVSRGRLGVSIQDLDRKGGNAAHGAVVGDVERGGPADRAGLTPGDVIVRAANTDIVHARDLTRAVARNAPGSRVELTVHRNGKDVAVPVVLGKLEDEPTNARRGR